MSRRGYGLLIIMAVGLLLATAAWPVVKEAGWWHRETVQERSCRQKMAVARPRQPPVVDVRRPPMGWNPYNFRGTSATEDDITGGIQAMARNGLRDVGYTFVNLDDGWQGPRDAEGRLTVNGRRFPCGLERLARYVHDMGFHFGIYTSPARRSCAGLPGSGGWFQQDVRQFAQWGVDFIKLDWCGENYDPEVAGRIVRDWQAAMAATGRPMVLSVNAGGHPLVLANVAPRAITFRVEGDICKSWQLDRRVQGCSYGANLGIKEYITQPDWRMLAGLAGPGHFADPDMLEIGNGELTPEEARTQLSIWAMWSAPLIAGHDPRLMKPGDIPTGVLLNREVIAVDQDPLGRVAELVQERDGIQVWRKPLRSGAVVAVVNMNDRAVQLNISPNVLGLPGIGVVRDLWTHQDLSPAAALATPLGPHDVRMLRFVT